MAFENILMYYISVVKTIRLELACGFSLGASSSSSRGLGGGLLGGGGAGLRDLGDEGTRIVLWRRRRASPSLLLQVAQTSSRTRI